MKFHQFSVFLMIITSIPVFALDLTEIMYNPSDGNEWVEFYTNTELNFSGYELTDNLNTDQIVCCGTCSFNIPQNTHFLILDQDSTLNFSGYKFCVDDNSIGNSLGNTNDRILISKNSVTYINFSYQKSLAQGNSLSYINSTWQESIPTPGYGFSSEEENNTSVPPLVNVSVNVSVNISINVTLPNNCTNTITYINLTCDTNTLNNTIVNLSIQLDECQSMILMLENESEEKDLLITLLQNQILNLSLSLAELDGCEFNNPRCPVNESCIEDACILKPGCQYDNPSCLEGYMCRNNECKPQEIAVFRTNIGNSRYYDRQGEIAVDADGDGKLDCFVYETFNWFYFSQHPIRLLKTMEGFEVHKLPKNRILIHDRIRNTIYARSTSCTIPLTNKSQEDFIGREVIR